MPRILLMALAPGDERVLKEGLKDKGFKIDVALDCDEGLWAAGEREYDVILIDVLGPGGTVRDVCHALRAAGTQSAIIVLASSRLEHDESSALESGADDFLAKPLSLPVLLARVRALQRRAAPRTPPPIEAGDLVIDPVRRHCTLAGADVALTRREFDVLEFLARRAGQTVSRKQLLDNVWDHAFTGDPNIVEVYVSLVRKKLQRQSGRRLIVTVRGQGYRLETHAQAVPELSSCLTGRDTDVARVAPEGAR